MSAVKLSELIAAYGDDKVQFQNLDYCADKLNMNGTTTKITFGTEQRLNLEGTEKLGLVVWLDRARVAEVRKATIAPTIPSRDKLAEAIHKARWPADRATAITPFEDEDRNGREYCYRIADAVMHHLAPERQSR